MKNSLIAALLVWYDQNRRRLPWRAASGTKPDPYHVLVSELMLQQTTVATVRQRFDDFINRFANLAALAEAEEADVLHAWQGLGYYRRARALHAAARQTVTQHGGLLPDDEAALLALPGIGAYTAKAMLAIAFDRPVVPVDGNVIRVLSRLYRIETPLPKATAQVQARAAELEPVPRPGDFAQALMDLGATVCRPKQPRCNICPWQTHCRAYHAGLAESLPIRAPKAARPVRHGIVFLIKRDDGAILFRRRPAKGLLGGLHELPSSRWETGPIDRVHTLNEAPIDAQWHLHQGLVKHVFTHFELQLELAETKTTTATAGLWCHPKDLEDLALPTVMKKVLRHAGIEIGTRN